MLEEVVRLAYVKATTAMQTSHEQYAGRRKLVRWEARASGAVVLAIELEADTANHGKPAVGIYGQFWRRLNRRESSH